MACTRWLTIVAGVSWLWGARAEAAEVLRTALVVRVYDAAGLTPAFEDHALTAAAESLRKALVDVHWKRCTPGPQPSEPSCARPLGLADGRRGALADGADREVSVRIVRGTAIPASATVTALGDAFVDTRSGDAVLATIYYNRVIWLATMAGTDPSTLLGRALAHELGHLLMHSNKHARNGLMRPTWTHEEVRRDRAGDWAFSSAEVRVIQRRSARF